MAVAVLGLGTIKLGTAEVRSWDSSLEDGRDPWGLVLTQCWHRAELGVPTCCRCGMFRNKQQPLLPFSCSRLSQTPGSHSDWYSLCLGPLFFTCALC